MNASTEQKGRWSKTHRVVEEESHIASPLPKHPNVMGDAVILTDTHIPFHDPKTIALGLYAGRMLKIKNLIIAGDVIHADLISRYDNAGPQVELQAELISTHRILRQLEEDFDNIYLIVGNHDQRIEKLCAKLDKVPESRNMMKTLAKILDVEYTPGDVAYGLLNHFFGSPKVHLHQLPTMTLNHVWRIIHPRSASRVSPQTERKLAGKHLQHVIAGHNHLFGIGFHDSGEFIAANIGHAAMDEKWRYQQEAPTHFPAAVRGCCVILCDEEAPKGRILPLANHPAWFSLQYLAARLEHIDGD